LKKQRLSGAVFLLIKTTYNKTKKVVIKKLSGYAVGFGHESLSIFQRPSDLKNY
jgi:hypothetical protein